MFNTELQDQLKDLKEAGMLKVKYPAGYKKWKAKFDYWFNITKDVNAALNCIYGPGASGVNNYKGSIYRNSGINPNGTSKKRQVH
jgi:hypothetical protein